VQHAELTTGGTYGTGSVASRVPTESMVSS
jgi:hypothetical protein